MSKSNEVAAKPGVSGKMPSAIGASENDKKRPTLPPRTGWLRRQFSDIIYVAKRDKKWWLLPLFFLVLLLAALMLVASSVGPLAPFVYPFL